MGGFRAFLTKSNALALAIGVIIGASLGSLVTTLVNAIIMPPIGWALNGVDFASIKTVLGHERERAKRSSIGWGLFINALIVFIVVMLVVYVISKMFIKEEEAAGPSPEEVLLTEIRRRAPADTRATGLATRVVSVGESAVAPSPISMSPNS